MAETDKTGQSMKQEAGARPEQPVKMSDVARAAGVSTMTVSRALRKDGPINEETRQRILQVVRELHYVPDLTAGSLSSKKSGFITVLLPSLNNLHFARTVQALSEALEPVGLQILLGYTNYCSDKEEELIELMLRRRPEAVILSYDGHTERTLALLKKASVPVVELWETPDEPIQHTVGFSNFEAAKQLTQALIAKGYRKLAFLGEAQDAGTRGAARRHGFVAAMEEAGLSAHRLVRHKSPPLAIAVGAEAGQILLDEYPDTDCVFCVSDPAAFGAMSAILASGRKVPDDIAVAGFGNFEVSRYATPPISTVSVDPAMVGNRAAELILQALDTPKDSNGAPMPPQHVKMKVELLMRAST